MTESRAVQIARRKQREYQTQFRRMKTNEAHFRKIARHQVQTSAILRATIAGIAAPTNAQEAIERRGVKSLRMTPELCGLFYKINRQRKMLGMEEYVQGYEMLMR